MTSARVKTRVVFTSAPAEIMLNALLFSFEFSVMQIKPQQIQSAQPTASMWTVRVSPSHVAFGYASLSVCLLQQHMVVVCCQGSLFPCLASPALGQMAAPFASKSNCPQDKRLALSSYLGSFSLPFGIFLLDLPTCPKLCTKCPYSCTCCLTNIHLGLQLNGN